MSIKDQFVKKNSSVSAAKKAPPPIGKTANLNISDIRTDGGTQSRWQCNTDVVDEYAEAISAGVTFPAVAVFYDETEYWLADGFHRVEAHQKAGKRKISAMILKGTCRDAILYSAGANHEHGLRRSNSDKARAILLLLEDEEWSKWSDREIARQCSVGHPLVAKIRAEHAPLHLEEIPDSRTVKRGGSTYTMDTSAIGRTAPAWPAPQEIGDSGLRHPAPSPTSPTTTAFDQFMRLADGLMNLNINEVVTAAAGRNRAALGQRASSLSDLMDEIRSRID